MKDYLLVIIPSVISLLSVVITGIITNSLVKYRVGLLEKQVEKHNSVLERVFIVETEVKDIKERIK